MQLFTALVLFSISAFQLRGPQLRGPVVDTDAVASFSGVLKSADKKWVILAVENSETLKMYVTGKTRFVRNGKPARPADFHDGDPVTIDAERDVRLNMLAVKVEFPAKQAPQEPK